MQPNLRSETPLRFPYFWLWSELSWVSLTCTQQEFCLKQRTVVGSGVLKLTGITTWVWLKASRMLGSESGLLLLRRWQYLVSSNKAAWQIFPICVLVLNLVHLCVSGEPTMTKLKWVDCILVMLQWGPRRFRPGSPSDRRKEGSTVSSFLLPAIFMWTQELIFLFWKEIIWEGRKT